MDYVKSFDGLESTFKTVCIVYIQVLLYINPKHNYSSAGYIWIHKETKANSAKKKTVEKKILSISIISLKCTVVFTAALTYLLSRSIIPSSSYLTLPVHHL